MTIWRVCTETLGNVPYAQPADGPITKIIFGSDGTARPWLTIILTKTLGMRFELVGGSLVESGEWYTLECAQGVKNGEKWMHIREKRSPTAQEVARMGQHINEVYHKWLLSKEG